MAHGIQRDIFMAAENYSRYQQSVIRNYYNNKDNVSLQRAQELLTDLYLAEGKKREKVWDSLFVHLERLGVPADQLQHLKEANNPELVAQLIQKKIWNSCYCISSGEASTPKFSTILERDALSVNKAIQVQDFDRIGRSS